MAKEVEKQTLNFFLMGMREFLGSFTDSKDPNWGRLIIAIFLLLIAFLFLGIEALKVIFRGTFIKGEANVIPIILASFAFLGWSWLCFSQIGEVNSERKNSLTFAGWLYLAISLIVLARGVYEWDKSNNRKKSGTILGESILLGFLKNSWWNEYRLKMFAEPLTVFAFALPLLMVDFYLGVPLVFCGISQVVFNVIFTIKQIEEAPDKLNSDKNSSSNRSTVQ